MFQGSTVQCTEEIGRGDTSLPEDACERSGSYLAVKWDDAPRASAAQYGMAAPLAYLGKSKTFQRAHSLGA